jgi:hypothetical protein
VASEINAMAVMSVTMTTFMVMASHNFSAVAVDRTTITVVVSDVADAIDWISAAVVSDEGASSAAVFGMSLTGESGEADRGSNDSDELFHSIS